MNIDEITRRVEAAAKVPQDEMKRQALDLAMNNPGLATMALIGIHQKDGVGYTMACLRSVCEVVDHLEKQ